MSDFSHPDKRVILVLGMHRSGTSAMAGLLHVLNTRIEASFSPTCADNPLGYWEIESIVKLNNRILSCLGLAWNDINSINLDLLSLADAHSLREEAIRLLTKEYKDLDSQQIAGPLILKDPRLTRLLPFWMPLLDELNIIVHPIFMVRAPIEVAISLQARLGYDDFKEAGIGSIPYSLLLWLRYQLDAISCCQTLGIRPSIVDFARLHENPHLCVNELSGLMPSAFIGVTPDLLDKAALFIQSDLYRNKRSTYSEVDNSLASIVDSLYHQISASQYLIDVYQNYSNLSGYKQLFDELCRDYQPLHATLNLSTDQDPWSLQIAKALALVPSVWRPIPDKAAVKIPHEKQPHVILVSGVPQSIAHIYRVDHVAEALSSAGWRVERLELDQVILLFLGGAEERSLSVSTGNRDVPSTGSIVPDLPDAIYFFRFPWQANVDLLMASCRRLKIRLIFGIDDLIFDTRLIDTQAISFIAHLNVSEQSSWRELCFNYRRCLRRCDHAVVTTSALAKASLDLVPTASVLPNGNSARLEQAASLAFALPKPDRADDRVTIGFASGTPTHQHDFAVVAEPIARLLRDESRLELVIIGELDVDKYGELSPFMTRIKRRPRVALERIYHELIQFDVNICPLEDQLLFCESKSPLRFINASMVAVPSVVSDSEPLRNAVVHGHTGLIAKTTEEWHYWLQALIRDSKLRKRIGEAARIDVRAQYGWTTWQQQCLSIFTEAIFPLDKQDLEGRCFPTNSQP